MSDDPIVAEIHEIRTQLLEEAHGDLSAWVATLMERQAASPQSFVHRDPKRPGPEFDWLRGQAAG